MRSRPSSPAATLPRAAAQLADGCRALPLAAAQLAVRYHALPLAAALLVAKHHAPHKRTARTLLVWQSHQAGAPWVAAEAQQLVSSSWEVEVVKARYPGTPTSQYRQIRISNTGSDLCAQPLPVELA